MENKDLLDAPIGDVGKFEIDFADGKLVFKLTAGKAGLVNGAVDFESANSVKVGPKVFLEMLCKAIPGELDDHVIHALEGAMGL